MEYMDVVVTPVRGYFHPVEERLRESSVALRRIHNIKLLRDGSTLMIYELDGDTGRTETVIDESPGVVYHSTSRRDRTVMAFLHLEPTDLLTDLLELTRTQRVVFDPPHEFVDPEVSAVEVRHVGPRRVLEEAWYHIKQRDDLEVHVESVGCYEPFGTDLFDGLTEKQKRVLLAAEELGYFDSPRGATHEDVADVLGCNATTVGHHLMKVQSRLIEGVVPHQDLGDTTDD